MKVLHCAETIKGGIATYMQELLPLQVARFGEGNVFVMVPDAQLSEIRGVEGVRVVPFNAGRGRVGASISLAKAYLRLCANNRFDVVHVHSTFAGAVIRPMARLVSSGSRVVYCSHGWAVDRPMSSFSRFLVSKVELVLSLLTDAVVCISKHDYVVATKIGISSSKLALVRNGISEGSKAHQSLDVSWPEDRSVLRILFVGRFDNQKGADVLVEALSLMGGQVFAVFAGGKVLSDGKEFSLPPNSVSVGWINREQLNFLFSNVDVLVVPSRWEGFGLTAVEGMRAGLPVVASRVGGLAEVVEDGLTGLLVEPGNAEALARSILSLDHARMDSMGRAGRCRFETHFTISRVHRELCEIYS